MESNSVILRVRNAKKRDIGRNTVRIDAEAMNKLNIQTGDIVSVYGKKESAGIVWPGYSQDRGLGIVRIDFRFQMNTGTTVDDTIEIRKVKTNVAQNVVLAPLDFSINENIQFESFIKRELNNSPVTIDDYIFTTNVLYKEIKLKVVNLKPQGVCIIKPETILSIDEEKIKEIESRVDHITYDDIVGLDDEINEIRMILFLQLKQDLNTEKPSMEVPKGILLVGPSGTGKTLLAKALIFENEDYDSISILAPDIIGKHYGESEKELKKLFKRAEERAPSIIFIDHIDSIAPKIKKEMIEKANFVEHRVVTQLLGLMDGLHSYTDVIVIGATHKLDLIEPALLRPGRFDKIIHFPLPDNNSRIKMFEIHTRNLELDVDVSLEDIAKQSENFTGAEIKGVCQLATLNAVKRNIPEMNVKPEEISDDLIYDFKINKQDFLRAIEEIRERPRNSS